MKQLKLELLMPREFTGFTLIELVFGLLISALLATMLYTCLYQFQRSARVMDKLLSVNMRVLTLKNQLSRDLAGAFMPPATCENQKYFFGESNSGNLQLLTFISTNPLRTAIETNPKVVRIKYQLSSVPEQPDSFKIQRTESEILDYSTLTDARAYTVIEEIKSLKVTYFMPEKQPEQLEKPEKLDKLEKSEKSGGGKVAKIVNKLELLKANFIAKQAGEFEDLPAYIKFNLELWNDHDHQDMTSYELSLPVYAYQQLKQSKPKKKPKAEKDQLGANQSGGNKLKKNKTVAALKNKPKS